MRAIYTKEGLTLLFSFGENHIGIALLESLADMYEENGVGAQPIRSVIEAMKNADPPGMLQ